jgi:branched-chain amino acid transport system permease protein
MMPKSTTGALGLGTLFLGLALLPLVVGGYYIELATTAIIAAMLALSLQLLVGCTGLVSLGHGAFYGLAAYVVYLVSPEGAAQPFFTTLASAVAVAALAAALVGALSLRTKGFFFLMVTLAFGQMIFFVFHDTKLGGGTDGAYLAKPLLEVLGYKLELTRRQRPVAIYYIGLAQLVAMYLMLVWVMRSLFGRVLTGIRVNEHRMLSLGFSTYRYKLAAFVIAGALAGVAGHMWALHRGFVNPELVGWHRSAESLLMILLGGLGTLHGPILGALAYTGLGEIAQLITERKLLVEGLVILAVVLALPQGLSGIRLWRRQPSEPHADGGLSPSSSSMPTGLVGKVPDGASHAD